MREKKFPVCETDQELLEHLQTSIKIIKKQRRHACYYPLFKKLIGLALLGTITTLLFKKNSRVIADMDLPGQYNLWMKTYHNTTLASHNNATCNEAFPLDFSNVITNQTINLDPCQAHDKYAFSMDSICLTILNRLCDINNGIVTSWGVAGIMVFFCQLRWPLNYF